MHDFNLWFAKELEKKVTIRLKQWAGLFRGCDLGALFRTREHLGLQLTSIVYHYQRMQLVKCCLLANSKDDKVRAIFEARRIRVMNFARRWSASKELSLLEPVVDHSLMHPSQLGSSGLGVNKADPYVAEPTVKELRSKTTSTLAMLREEKFMQHASCLVRQGVWTHWNNVKPFDLSWSNLIYGPGPRVIGFVLNAQINSVRTPDMLKLWGYTQVATCPLCQHRQCTLHHLLVGCDFALKQGRYTWRHDSVLLDMESAFMKVITTFNSRKPSCFGEIAKKDYKQSFIAAGTHGKKRVTDARSKSLLDYANDWKLQVDFEDRKLVFPPNICTTSLRPDIVISSALTRNVILLELTCCAEEGVQAAHLRKDTRYAELMVDIAANNWTGRLFTLEVGARGLVGSRTFRSLVTIGFTHREANCLCKSLSEIVARCSYAIYLAHSSVVWPHNKDLVVGKSTEPETKVAEVCLKPEKAKSLISLMLPSCANMVLHNCFTLLMLLTCLRSSYMV